jgi:hypothetical protein
VNVISAIGAIIGCITLSLIMLTLLLAFRVYIKGKKTMLSKEEIKKL